MIVTRAWFFAAARIRVTPPVKNIRIPYIAGHTADKGGDYQCRSPTAKLVHEHIHQCWIVRTSTASGMVTLIRDTVSENGYRLQTTKSIYKLDYETL